MKSEELKRLRILGKGKTAQAIKGLFPDAKMYDDENIDEFDIDSNDLTVVSPGIPPSNYLVKNTKKPVSDYDLFLSSPVTRRSLPFSIWISGTNGKTTTTQMIHHLLKDKGSLCGGNIGMPLANLIYELDSDYSSSASRLFVLETSSFTLHYTNTAKPNIYVLLPVSEDHISWHGNFKEYEASKLKPLAMMGKDDIAIIPSIYKDIKSDAVIYTYESSDDLCKLFEIDKEDIRFNEPFLLDALLALSVQRLVSDEIDCEKINNFKVDAHKVEEFRDKKGNLWVDDSKATNIDATIWALKGYKDKKIFLILGGDDKGADLTPVFKELKKYDIKLYSIGKNSQKIEDISKEYDIFCKNCKFLSNAVDMIKKEQIDQNSEVSILSPAAASLDQFNSYKHRGEEFKKLCLN